MELDHQHVGRYSSTHFSPVFIIGDHRSGTTVLYQLLASTGAFNVVTAYHVIRYGEIVDNHLKGRTEEARDLLAHEFDSYGLANRGLDGVKVTPDLPEEYGFIMGRESRRPHLRPETREIVANVCRKVRFTGRDAPVLLKNPWDVLTFDFVKQAFPDAKFVFLHRHPLNTMNSQLVAWRFILSDRNEYLSMLSPWYRKLFDRPAVLAAARAMGTTRFGLGARIVGRHARKVADYYLSHINRMPGADWIELRYEDLCVDPERHILRVLDFLGLQTVGPLRVQGMVNPRAPKLLPGVSERFAHIQSSMGEFLTRQGYTDEP